MCMKIKLIYSHDNIKEPILSDSILKTGIKINILEAKITSDKGEMVIDVPAEGEKLEEIITFFEKNGVIVKQVSKSLQIDRKRCISCGACVSPCPVHAIAQNKAWEIEFYEERCIGCRICISACPFSAIQML